MADDREKNLDEMTVSELRDRASELEITGRSSMNKDELRTAVEDAEVQTASLHGDAGDSPSSSATEAESSDADSRASSDADSSGNGKAESSGSRSGSSEQIDAGGITAPSIGPNTVIERKPPDERLDEDKISDVDAMGLDKRRQVQGKRYGASPAKQLAVYGGFLVLLAGLVVGGKLLTDELDTAPETRTKIAPWAEADVEQRTPQPIDFPKARNQ